jgi:chromosome segregation ATPase
MKTPVVILSVICVALAAALFLRNRSANSAQAAATKTQQSLSDEIAQFRVKLIQAQVQGIQIRTNLQAALDRRTAELINASNRVVQLKAIWATTQEEVAQAQRDLAAQSERITAVETQRDGLNRKLDIVPGLEKQLAETKGNLGFLLSDREALEKERQRLQLQNAELQRQLGDPDFLRAQTARVEEEIQARRRLASAKPGGSPDLRRPLVLQGDGSVRLAAPSDAPASK